MHDALVISQFVSWIAIVALTAVVFALVRQIGVLHERIAPMGALTIDKGPKVGDRSKVFELETLDHQPLQIGAPNERQRSTLLMFVSPTCPVCKKLLPAVKSMAANEARWLDLVFTSDGDPSEQADFARKERLEGFRFALSAELGVTYRVSKLPYAVLIDEEGVVRAKGLVNTREHLESIVQAKQMGVASLQEYLTSRHEHAAHGNGEREHHG